jgi:putative acetyltransferase
MFCPNCRSEYRPGFTQCSECNVPLLDTLPAESAAAVAEPDARIVTVYRTSDQALIALAQSLLESAGIDYVAKGEGVQDFFAMGRVANNFNIVVGPVEIQVEEKDAAEAAALLKDLETNIVELPDDDEAFFVGDCEIRAERPEDFQAIRELHTQAFRRHAESRLVDLLRARNQSLISLVAVCGDEIAGHLMFSPVTVEKSFAGFRGAGLGPVAVRREFQNNGIGSKLVQRGIEECRRADCDAIFVLGNPDFWRRFGFAQASAHRLTSQYNAAHSFLVLELKTGTIPRLNGLVRYATEFAECGC